MNTRYAPFFAGLLAIGILGTNAAAISRIARINNIQTISISQDIAAISPIAIANIASIIDERIQDHEINAALIEPAA